MQQPKYTVRNSPGNPEGKHSTRHGDNEVTKSLMNISIPRSTVEKAVTDDFLDQLLNPSNLPIDNTTELLILIDSNSNHLDRRKFWRVNNTKWERCGTAYEAGRAIRKVNYHNLQYVLVSLGVNDIDDVCGITDDIHMIYPNVKVIVSELTPRNDNRDEEVIECNKPLVANAKSKDYMYFAKQSNLRDPDYSFFDDSKHIKKTKVGRYASNLKIALRKAYGIEDPRERNSGNQDRPWQQQWTPHTYHQINTSTNYNKDQRGLSRVENPVGGNNEQHTRRSIEENCKMDLKRRLLQLLS